MAIEKETVSLGSLSHFLHYFEQDLDKVGISNYSHEQAFSNGLKISVGQMKRLNYFFMNSKNEELKQFLRELKMI